MLLNRMNACVCDNGPLCLPDVTHTMRHNSHTISCIKIYWHGRPHRTHTFYYLFIEILSPTRSLFLSLRLSLNSCICWIIELTDWICLNIEHRTQWRWNLWVLMNCLRQKQKELASFWSFILHTTYDIVEWRFCTK